MIHEFVNVDEACCKAKLNEGKTPIEMGQPVVRLNWTKVRPLLKRASLLT